MDNTRTAILKAADHIEANPSQFDFMQIKVPACGSPGCAVGWIGHFKGIKAGEYCWVEDTIDILGVISDTFMQRMHDIARKYGTTQWTDDSQQCATALRHYADKHHPAEDEYPEVNEELDRIFKEALCEQRSTHTKVS